MKTQFRFITLLIGGLVLATAARGQVSTTMDDFLHANDRTVTDSAALTWAQTWNDGTEAMTGMLLDYTDTASASGTLTLDIQVGASSLFSVGKTGIVNTAVGFDGIGAVDMDYGSADVTDHTFTTDGTGTAEIVLPAGSIDGTEILDDTIDSADYAAGSIDNEHLAVDIITADEMADADHGDFTWASGTATLDDDVVAAAEMADADHGDITWSSGSATLDDDVVAAAEMADADHGQVSWSSGTATVEAHTRFIEKHATSHTLTAGECYGAVYYITGAGVTLTLPAAADGMSLRVICTTGNVGIVDADAGDLIILDGTALDDGDAVDSAGGAGDVIDLHYYDATGWYGVSITGTWVDGGAS